MLLDTSAWIELFRDGESTEKIKKVLMSENCYTSIVTIAEITNWAEKENMDYITMTDGIEKLTTVLGLDRDLALLAGRLNFERKKTNKKWGMLDSFVLATGIIYDLKILTKDSDFKDVPQTKLL